MSEIPDFTISSWQAKRSDHQLTASILDGKGTHMPAFRDNLKKEQIQALVAHVRALDPSKSKTVKDGRTTQAEDPPSDFEKRFRELQKQLDDLQRQFRELSGPPRKP